MSKTSNKAAKSTSKASDLQHTTQAPKVAEKPVSEAKKGDTAPILVVIPFLPSEMQGCQIQLAVAGWRQHFKEKFHIVIVGEGLSCLDDHFGSSEDVTLLESERVAEKAGNYRSHLDYVKCFRAVRERFTEQDGFIFVADDCFAVNDFTLDDVKRLKIHSDDFNGDVNNPYNGWQRDAGKTRALLDREHLPHRNFTTHLPMWFDWDKWEEIVSRYDMDNESYVIEALYYNTYHGHDEAVLLNHSTDNIRCWMGNGNISPHDVFLALSNKIWVCCSVNGYSYIVEDLLKKHLNLV